MGPNSASCNYKLLDCKSAVTPLGQGSAKTVQNHLESLPLKDDAKASQTPTLTQTHDMQQNYSKSVWWPRNIRLTWPKGETAPYNRYFFLMQDIKRSHLTKQGCLTMYYILRNNFYKLIFKSEFPIWREKMWRNGNTFVPSSELDRCFMCYSDLYKDLWTIIKPLFHTRTLGKVGNFTKMLKSLTVRVGIQTWSPHSLLISIFFPNPSFPCSAFPRLSRPDLLSARITDRTETAYQRLQ